MISSQHEHAIAERILSHLTARQLFCLRGIAEAQRIDWMQWVLTGIQRQHPELLEWPHETAPALTRLGHLVLGLRDIEEWHNQDMLSLRYYGAALEIRWRMGAWTGALRMLELPIPSDFRQMEQPFRSAEEREEVRSLLRLLTRMPDLDAVWEGQQCQWEATVAGSERRFLFAIDSSDGTIPAQVVIIRIANIVLARGVI